MHGGAKGCGRRKGRLDRIVISQASAAAEYLAQFRTDLEAFVSIEAVRA
jgi:hypothetical protein